MGDEACHLIVRDREFGRPVDRDVVVVEQHDQLVELQVPRERDRLMADALHQATVAGDAIGMVIDQRVAVARVQHALGQRHADGIAETLPQRTGRGLDTLSMPVLGMARRLAVDLTEALDLIDGHLWITGQVEQRVEQHRAVTGGQNKSVAIRPFGMLGIKFQKLRE
jgi:hypothetical protein